jgi:tetratricopeptide (TPR) repeat protein
MFLLSLAFTGVFIGLVASNSNKEISMSFLSDHRKSFFSILVLILVVIFFSATAFKYIERFTSISYFGKTLSSATTEATMPAAEDSIGKAIALYSNDLYLRTYSQIYLAEIKALMNKGSQLTDQEKQNLQADYNAAVSGAQAAVNYDSKNYLNYQQLGSVFQTAGGLGVKDGYTNAVANYKQASLLNPLNPGLKLAVAGVFFADGKIKEAKEAANEALSLKGDYIDALVTLAEIAKKEGNTAEALSYAKTALSITPTDKNLIDYVNSLGGSASAGTSITTPTTTTTTTPTTKPVKK